MSYSFVLTIRCLLYVTTYTLNQYLFIYIYTLYQYLSVLADYDTVVQFASLIEVGELGGSGIFNGVSWTVPYVSVCHWYGYFLSVFNLVCFSMFWYNKLMVCIYEWLCSYIGTTSYLIHSGCLCTNLLEAAGCRFPNIGAVWERMVQCKKHYSNPFPVRNFSSQRGIWYVFATTGYISG